MITMVAWFTVVVYMTTSFLVVSSLRNKEKERKQQGNYLCGCFIQSASDTNISHATRVTTLWLKLFS